MLETSECDFFNPVNWQGNPPVEGEFWNFASSSCAKNLDYIQYVSSTNGAGFYLDQKISYGDIFIVFFLLFFLCWGIFRAVCDFIFPTIIKALTQRDL